MEVNKWKECEGRKGNAEGREVKFRVRGKKNIRNDRKKGKSKGGKDGEQRMGCEE